MGGGRGGIGRRGGSAGYLTEGLWEFSLSGISCLHASLLGIGTAEPEPRKRRKTRAYPSSIIRRQTQTARFNGTI